MRRRLVTLFFAVFFALPAVGFAGSATSRWDMTIGGYVKFDMGWGSQSQAQDAVFGQRQGNGPYDNATDQNGSFYMYAGETRLNFLTRGPDAWGAKTMAFIEGSFQGQATPGNSPGTFFLRHAFMQLLWPNQKLTIGQTWQTWGFLPAFGYYLMGFSDLGPFLKGTRQPQVKFEQTFAKNWTWSFDVISPTNTLGANPNSTTTGVVDSFTLSQMPFFEGSVGWKTDKCGTIGEWPMMFALEGFYGRQKQLYTQVTGPAASPTAQIISGRNVDAWGISFKGFIPIIPEKKGNKAGALDVAGVVWYTQNPSWLTAGVSSYARPYDTSTTPVTGVTAGTPSFAAPVQYGGWGQLQYFITDQLVASGWFAYYRNNLSQAYMNVGANANVVQNTTQYIVTLAYDVNQAIRFGIEGAYFNTRYAGYPTIIGGIPVAQKDGSYYTARVGAYYFF